MEAKLEALGLTLLPPAGPPAMSSYDFLREHPWDSARWLTVGIVLGKIGLAVLAAGAPSGGL
jgi:hypothetical protein